ncbi:MAG TPA: PhzF family phenazine biosynthesis protein [Lapillicoccus sp.]|nr:PhzF family phenazine biosynthesis protein [Lapillicoccus sp.]
MDLAYRIVNVFTVGDDPFSGNPLAIFEDAAGVSDEQMQAIARQLNLSETTFVTGPGEDGVDADVRIFTPEYELPFAGHPTLGTAYVVSSLLGGRDHVVLGMPAGRVPVAGNGSRWVLTTAVAPSTRQVDVATEDLAAMVGVDPSDIGDGPLWVDTGIEQLILPLTSVDAVRRAQVDPRLLRAHGESNRGEALVYLWAPTGDETVEARLFFTQGAGAIEDPATGSACANLGGWWHARGERGMRRTVRQGDAVHRPSVLQLEVDGDGGIHVGGTVLELGTGVFRLSGQ